MLVSSIRGPILEDNLVTKVQENCPRNNFALMTSQHDRTAPSSQELIAKLQEELERLRWQSMQLAGMAIEAIEMPESIRGDFHSYGNTSPDSIPDVSPGAIPQRFIDGLFPFGQIKSVAIEADGDRGFRGKSATTSHFDVVPTCLLSVLGEKGENILELQSWGKYQTTIIGKWQ
jgi:hypothetical protein